MARARRPAAGAEKPVFLDSSGARWRRVKRYVAVGLLACAGLTAWLLPRAFAGTSGTRAPTAASIADSLAGPLPVVGTGTLLRVLRVQWVHSRPYASDPFTGQTWRALSAAEMQRIGWSPFAVERFGRMPARQLALTFDDGPDPRNTPALLDLLSRHRVPATFFDVGANILAHPAIYRRQIAEGHLVGNHTYTHARLRDAGALRAHQEVVATNRVMRAVGGYQSRFFRLPYGGDDTESIAENARGILEAQELGQLAANFDIDTKDWEYAAGQTVPVPRLDGRGHVLLLHDGGSDRTATLALVEQIIVAARAQGYTFSTMAPLHPDGPAHGATRVGLIDRLTYRALWSVQVLPGALLRLLFVLGAGTMILVSAVGVGLALAARRRHRRRPPPPYEPFVSVLIAAFDEADVIGKTLASLRRSAYPAFEVIVVDDGSTDGTLDVLRRAAADWPALRVLTQTRGGKAAALNRGIAAARAEVLVTFDADTVVLPDTLSHLARHFADDRVGAVAGLVKVGNRRGLLTRWQSLEYLSGICVERMAQGMLGAIMIVPGACAGWRRSAVTAVGGYSSHTLAEDCDLTLSLQRARYRIVQDNDAVAYTEAPQTPRALVRQRFRWMFGNLQSIWKHRAMFGRPRYGALGTVVMPYTAVSILVPLVFLPFTYLIVGQAVVTGNGDKVLLFAALLTAFHFTVALFAVTMVGERYWHLLLVPVYRLIYEPLRTYLLYATALAVLRGRMVSWNKLARTNSVRFRDVPHPAAGPPAVSAPDPA